MSLSDIELEIKSSIIVISSLLEDKAFLYKLEKIVSICIKAINRGNRILIAGNGSSAADAQHLAAQFVSRYAFNRPSLPAIALTTDSSILTAIGNDYGFDKIFERQLEANGKSGDIFIALSTSGNSSNIVRALQKCSGLNITTVGFSGISGEMGKYCDHLLAIPSSSSPRIQEAHIVIGHVLCFMVEKSLFSQEDNNANQYN